MNAILIINPKSGKSKKVMPPILQWTFRKMRKKLGDIYKSKPNMEEIIEEVTKRCDKEGIKLDIEITRYSKHAIKLARNAKDKYDFIIAAGGDGLVNEVINGMHNSKATLVIIPFGTTNVLALELNISFNIKKAARLITKGKKIEIDLGHAKTKQQSRYFALQVGIGFVPNLINDVSSKLKKRFGKFAFFLIGLRSLFTYKWYDIHVDHGIHSVGYYVLISNTKNYAGEYELTNKASISDGLLDLVVIDRRNFWKIIRILFSFATGKSKTFLIGERYQIKEAKVYSYHKMLVQMDGEIIGEAPVAVKVAPKALNVMVNKHCNKNMECHSS
jgi:diacylglycerol kinase (ATP)